MTTRPPDCGYGLCCGFFAPFRFEPGERPPSPDDVVAFKFASFFIKAENGLRRPVRAAESGMLSASFDRPWGEVRRRGFMNVWKGGIVAQYSGKSWTRQGRAEGQEWRSRLGSRAEVETKKDIGKGGGHTMRLGCSFGHCHCRVDGHKQTLGGRQSSCSRCRSAGVWSCGAAVWDFGAG